MQDNININKGANEEERIADMKDAIMRGLKLVDNYYEKVQVPAESDSEDEDAPKEILRSKDIYSDRPLPFIIGSDEWHKKWHVGLIDSSSDDEETQQDKEQFSEDDVEDKRIAKNFVDAEQVSV